MLRKTCLILLFSFFVLFDICAVDSFSAEEAVIPANLMDVLKETHRAFPQSSQIIIVKNAGPEITDALVIPFEKTGNAWREEMGPLAATIGRNGFAPVSGKREGDGRTPGGAHPLGFVFGYGPKINSAMPYRQMTPNDIWVDDPASPDYNRLKKRGQTRARSFEDMILPDDRYKYGIVIEYNTHPVIAGHGSAIFLHVWKTPGTPTSGCIAISEENILKLLQWLDPAKRPLIVLGAP